MKSKKIFPILILFITALLIFSNPGISEATDWTVCPDLGICDYDTIQSVIYAATSGDRVVVGTPGRITPETYNENITMKGGVDVVSEGDDSTTTYTDPWGTYSTTVLKRATLTIINGNGTDVVVHFNPHLATSITFDGFTVQNVDEGALNGVFLIRMGANEPIIKNNIIRDNQATGYNGGIQMQDNTGGLISPQILNNVIHYTKGPGIGNGNMTAALISGNEIFTTFNTIYAVGIGLKLAAAPTIINNKIFNCGRAGIGSREFGVNPTVFPGIPIVIKGNEISDNPWEAGIYIENNTGSSDIQVEIGGSSAADSNHIYNTKAGIFVKGADAANRIDSVVIENNNIDNNFIGLRLDYIDTLVVRNNSISDSTTRCGIRSRLNLDVTMEGNDIYGNAYCGVFIDNGSQALNIKDNDIYSNGLSGIRIYAYPSGTITQNRIYQNTYGGIGIQSNLNSLQITKNEIHDNIRGGIHTGKDLVDGGGFVSTPGSAVLTISQNRIYNNGQSDYGGGIDVRHASGTIKNNLVYNNHRAGIRYSEWIDEIINNTVVDNGDTEFEDIKGGGIIYDDLAGEVNLPPDGYPPAPIPIRNNIVANNELAGIRVGVDYDSDPFGFCLGALRDYNLLSDNFTSMEGVGVSCCKPVNCCGNIDPNFPICEEQTHNYCVYPQLGGPACDDNTYEIFKDPLFVDIANNDYHLQADSPAIDAGDPDPSYNDIDGTRNDMGAYGGLTPLDNAAPEILGVFGSVGSNIILVAFSEGVYSDSSGDLVSGDFALTDEDNLRTITGVSHTAGDNSAVLTLNSMLDSVNDIGTDTVSAFDAASIYDVSDDPGCTTPVVISYDPNPPTISNQNPANGTTDIDLNSNLTFTLSDSEGNLDWSTFQIQLTGNKGYSKTYTSASPEVYKTGTTASYVATVDPDTDFGSEETITVTVDIDDLAGNSLVPPAWSFTSILTDSLPPVISARYPPPGRENAYTAESVGFFLTENETTIDWDTFSVTLEGNLGFGPVTYPYNHANITNYSIYPDTQASIGVDHDLFGDFETITVTVTVSDVAGNALILNREWSFTTGDEEEWEPSCNTC